MYFLTLSRLRSFVGQFPQFRAKGAPLPTNAGGKVKLTTAGDLLVGSTARTGVGFILMPFTLLKTLSEVTFARFLVSALIAHSSFRISPPPPFLVDQPRPLPPSLLFVNSTPRAV